MYTLAGPAGADVDAYNIAYEARKLKISFAEVFPSYYTLGHANARFTDFFNHRFRTLNTLYGDAIEVMTGGIKYEVARNALIVDVNISEDEFAAISLAFCDKILYYVEQGK